MLSYLSPSKDDVILDVGCGDGILSAQVAETIQTHSSVHGLDSSSSMISTARQTYPDITFEVQDCTRLSAYLDATSRRATYDKVFSNAALHWILRDPATRLVVLEDICAALKPGGTFVFEMGGAGNVAEVHTALIAALTRSGVSVTEAKETTPWFFPSEAWMRRALEDVGFEVRTLELEYRPTKLTENTVDGSGGLEGWLKLMGAQFLEKLPGDKDATVKWMVEILENTCFREEDESWWIGYVRLRGVATKK